MLLITVTRIPGGHRLIATSTYQARYYCWSLYRSGVLLDVISRSYRGENSIRFDLLDPLASGEYELRVECFGWHPQRENDNVTETSHERHNEFYYHTRSTLLQTISQRSREQAAGHRNPSIRAVRRQDIETSWQPAPARPFDESPNKLPGK